MEHAWQLQDAKNKFSEVVEKAAQEGPQTITRHGKKTAVVLSISDYQRLKHRRFGLVDFFRHSPLVGLSFERFKDLPRRIDLTSIDAAPVP
jgi:antitoxin Phd